MQNSNNDQSKQGKKKTNTFFNYTKQKGRAGIQQTLMLQLAGTHHNVLEMHKLNRKLKKKKCV